MDSRYIEILVTETRGVKRLRRKGTSFVWNFVLQILFEEGGPNRLLEKVCKYGNTFVDV